MKKKGLIIFLAVIFPFFICSSAYAGYSIVISKANNVLSLYKDGSLYRTFPVATGRHPSLTPEGTFTIASKLVNPYYAKKNIPGGSPHNPLGPRWMGLSIGGGGVYGIHGTNNPSSIGTYASAGCIRMYSKDAIWLYSTVPLGTKVTITSTPAKTPAKKVVKKTPPPPPPYSTLSIDDQNYKFLPDQMPYRYNNISFLPARFTAEKLGYTVAWDGTTNTTNLIKGKDIIKIKPGDKTVTVNDNPYTLKNTPAAKNNRLYLPRDFFDLLPNKRLILDPEKETVFFQ